MAAAHRRERSRQSSLRAPCPRSPRSMIEALHSLRRPLRTQLDQELLKQVGGYTAAIFAVERMSSMGFASAKSAARADCIVCESIDW